MRILILAIVLLTLANRASASGTYFRPSAHNLGQQIGLERGEHRLGLRPDFQEYSRVRLRTGLYQNVRDVRLRTYSFTGEYALANDSLLYGAIPVADNDAA